MDKVVMSMLVIFFILIMLDNVINENFSKLREEPYSSSSYIDGEYDHLYEHTLGGITNSLQRHYFVSKERILEDSMFQLISYGDKMDVEVLLSFRKSIT